MIRLHLRRFSIWYRRAAALCACVCMGVAAGGVTSERISQPDLSIRQQLAKLDPGSPDAYFALGELLSATAESESDHLLASQTLAIGVGIAYRHGEFGLAASMSIALASIEADPDMAASLWDFALMIDSTRQSAWVSFRNNRYEENAQLRQDAARCLYAARFNDQQTALQLFELKSVRDTIFRVAREATLDPTRIDQLVAGLIRDGSDDECKGRVFVSQRSEGEVRRIVCPDHTRPVGAGPDDESLRQLITLEMVLLNDRADLSIGDAWELNTYLRLEKPARDPSLAMIADYYRVEFARPYWRGDRWASSP